MTTKPMQFLSRFTFATLFVAVGLIASAPVAQAQCSPEDCLTSKTERIEVSKLQPAPLFVLAAPTVDADRLVCHTPPDCLLAKGTPAAAGDDTAAPRTEAGCDTSPDCLEAPRRLSEAAKAARRE